MQESAYFTGVIGNNCVLMHLPKEFQIEWKKDAVLFQLDNFFEQSL